MTVCVAAICEKGNFIVGTSDRMVTVGGGETSYEGTKPKKISITSAVEVLIAGDIGLNLEIASKVRSSISDLKANDANESVTVEYVAELYQNCFTGIRTKRAEAAILSPLALDLDSFHQNQDRYVCEKFANYQMPEIEAIITGIDNSGAHLYLASNSFYQSSGRYMEIENFDSAGYLIIGIGKNHAESEFMFQGFSSDFNISDTLLLTYIAKRRAEKSLGVGQHTDIFICGNAQLKPDTWSSVYLGKTIVPNLSTIYDIMRLEEENARVQASVNMLEFVAERFKSAFDEKITRDIVIGEKQENTVKEKTAGKTRKQRADNKKQI